MAKYDERFKLRAVKKYLKGNAGTKAVADELGIGRTVLRRWVASYKHHGQEGLIARRKPYGARAKLAVLKHMWSKELSYQAVTAVFDIRDATAVARWERLYHEGGIEALEPRPRGRPKKMTVPEPPTSPPAQTGDTRSLEDLRKENALLRAEVAYLKKLDALAQAKKAARQKKRK